MSIINELVKVVFISNQYDEGILKSMLEFVEVEDLQEEVLWGKEKTNVQSVLVSLLLKTFEGIGKDRTNPQVEFAKEIFSKYYKEFDYSKELKLNLSILRQNFLNLHNKEVNFATVFAVLSLSSSLEEDIKDKCCEAMILCYENYQQKVDINVVKLVSADFSDKVNSVYKKIFSCANCLELDFNKLSVINRSKVLSNNFLIQYALNVNKENCNQGVLLTALVNVDLKRSQLFNYLPEEMQHKIIDKIKFLLDKDFIERNKDDSILGINSFFKSKILQDICDYEPTSVYSPAYISRFLQNKPVKDLPRVSLEDMKKCLDNYSIGLSKDNMYKFGAFMLENNFNSFSRGAKFVFLSKNSLFYPNEKDIRALFNKMNMLNILEKETKPTEVKRKTLKL